MWRRIWHFLALLKGEIQYPGATDEAAPIDQPPGGSGG